MLGSNRGGISKPDRSGRTIQESSSLAWGEKSSVGGWFQRTRSQVFRGSLGSLGEPMGSRGAG